MDSHSPPFRTETSSSTNGSPEHRRDRHPSIKEEVFRAIKSGHWEHVLNEYEKNTENIQTASITSSKEKVLHIAVSHNRSDVAEKLLGFVADGKVIKEMKNDRDNNPLHLAASLGKADMCEAMMGKEPGLIHCRNRDGETPLFLAALHGRKEAFYTLRRKWTDITEEDVSIQWIDIKRNDGNSILHVTILGEYFDLAFQIIHLYPKLATFRNERGQTPLHILALHPSFFRSGFYLGPLEDFIYRCLLVEELKDEKGQSSSWITAEHPGNYVTCFNALEIFRKGLRAGYYSNPALACSFIGIASFMGEYMQGLCTGITPSFRGIIQVLGPETSRFHWFKGGADIETPQSSTSEISVQVVKAEPKEKNRPSRPIYYTCFSLLAFLLAFLLELLLVVCGLGIYKVTRLKEKKRRHVHSTQLLKKLVKAAHSWEAEDNGSRPSEDSRNNLKDSINDMYNEFPGTSVDETSSAGAPTPTGPEEVAKDTNEKSPFLVAAKMGVIEMVKEILDEFPVAIDDMNQEKKNAVLLAVENRQPSVYLHLQKTYGEKESIFQKVDCRGNSALHLAAAASGPNFPWHIPGAALQMQWELKWYKFVKDSMPRQFFTYFNDRRQTPNEVLTETHTKLVDDARKWLTKTSESCSIVAALIATVAFASATTLPGGVKEGKGTPTFEGKPALDIFIISSQFALSFSITSLTMFLSILTSRFQVSDFFCSLPSKLILGLSSLFASIASILVAFGSGHFLSINYRHIFPIYAATCLPLTIFAVAQFPLYLDLIRSMMARVPKRSFENTFI